MDPYLLRIDAAGRAMADLGWAVHVTDQIPMRTGLIAWTATLSHHGHPVAGIEDHGAGGAPVIRFGGGGGTADPAAVNAQQAAWETDLAAAQVDADTAVAGLDALDLELAVFGGSDPGQGSPALGDPLASDPADTERGPDTPGWSR